jgi:hypothetical protein
VVTFEKSVVKKAISLVCRPTRLAVYESDVELLGV